MAYPVILRFEPYYPANLRKMQKHVNRDTEDLEHVDTERSKDNIWLHGGKEFGKVVDDLIEGFRDTNLANHKAALKALHRVGAAKACKETKPYRETTGGPLREAILSVKADYFWADEDDPDPYIGHRTTPEGTRVPVRFSRKKIAAFVKRGEQFFEEHFPGQAQHLRVDLDEEAPHFHALIMVVKKKTTKRRGEQTLIQPSSNPLIKSYEHAQDVVGAFFADLGLERGQQRAEERRKARKRGDVPPEQRKHISPQEYREQRAVELVKREDSVLEEAQRQTEIASKLMEREAELETKKKELDTKQNDLATEQKDLNEREDALTKDKEIFATEKIAVSAGLDALATQELVVKEDPKTNEATFFYGPSAPKEPDAKRSMWARIFPARDFVLSIGRQLRKLRGEAMQDRAAAKDTRQQADALRSEAEIKDTDASRKLVAASEREAQVKAREQAGQTALQEQRDQLVKDKDTFKQHEVAREAEFAEREAKVKAEEATSQKHLEAANRQSEAIKANADREAQTLLQKARSEQQAATRSRIEYGAMLSAVSGLVGQSICYEASNEDEPFHIADGHNDDAAPSLLANIRKAPAAAAKAAKGVLSSLQGLTLRDQKLQKDRDALERHKASIDFGMRMVDEGYVEYSPQNNKLIFGKAVPRDEQEMKAIIKEVQPALEVTKAYARRIWNSEPATIGRTLNEDPELFDVEVSHDIDKNADPDDALKYTIKVKMTDAASSQSPIMQALLRVAETMGDKIGAAVIPRARKTLRREFAFLQKYEGALLEAGVSIKDPDLRQRIAGSQVGLQTSLKSPLRDGAEEEELRNRRKSGPKAPRGGDGLER